MKHPISTHCFGFLDKLVLWSPGAVDLAPLCVLEFATNREIGKKKSEIVFEKNN